MTIPTLFIHRLEFSHALILCALHIFVLLLFILLTIIINKNKQTYQSSIRIN